MEFADQRVEFPDKNQSKKVITKEDDRRNQGENFLLIFRGVRSYGSNNVKIQIRQ